MNLTDVQHNLDEETVNMFYKMLPFLKTILQHPNPIELIDQLYMLQHDGESHLSNSDILALDPNRQSKITKRLLR